MPKPCNWLTPDWPAPPSVRALVSLREGGHSVGPYQGLNLGLHVGDDEQTVLLNRRTLFEAAQLPKEPNWLNQVHGTHVATLPIDSPLEADASVAIRASDVSCVMTADCLPVFLCDKKGSRVSAIHAGWRGLAAGVIESAFEALGAQPDQVLAWMGPAIGLQAFEVGQDVVEAFADSSTPESFQSTKPGKWLANIYDLARVRFQRLGIRQIYGGDLCTYSDPKRFFSYRRDKVTGRMASMIWIEGT